MARGFLLVEALIGATILGVILAAMIDQLGFTQKTINQAANREIAASLARDKLEELLSGHLTAMNGTQNGSYPLFDSVSGYLQFNMRWKVGVSGLDTSQLPMALPSATTLLEVVVNVRYPLGANQTQTLTARRLWSEKL
jgi:type II secretory pathway pseudopilin PulG